MGFEAAGVPAARGVTTVVTAFSYQYADFIRRISKKKKQVVALHHNTGPIR
jgi:hypothetical protein